jgi:hypothetical protein
MNLNLEGSHLLQAAIEQTGYDYGGNTYGGLVLHVANNTSLEKVNMLVLSALDLIDDETRGALFEFIDQEKSNINTLEFWKNHQDEMFKKSALHAFRIWNKKGLEFNKEKFQILQNLIFNAILFNFVMAIQRSNESRSFVRRAIGHSFLARLFS